MEGPVPTTATITVQSKSGAPLDPEQLTLQVNGQGYADSFGAAGTTAGRTDRHSD